MSPHAFYRLLPAVLVALCAPQGHARENLCSEGDAETRLQCLIELRCAGLEESDAAACYRGIIMALLGTDPETLEAERRVLSRAVWSPSAAAPASG